MNDDPTAETNDPATDRLDRRLDTLAPALGRTWYDDAPWRFITDLTALGSRMGGSEGERRAAELISDAFESAGLQNVHADPFEVQTWERGETTLEITTTGRDGSDTVRPFDAIALPYSPAGRIEGPFVDVGYGTPEEIDDEDVDGAIVVASTTTPPGSRFIHRMEKFGYAVEQGATGFVFVNHLDGQLPPTGSLTFGAEATTVAVGVSKETGAWLREYATNTPGTAGMMTLSVDAQTTPGESRNVHGTLGPDTNERVLLVAHYDGHDIAEGALDNGCGIATIITAASVLADADLDIGVDVVAVGCEETGLLGSEQLANQRDPEAVRSVVNVDGAGRFRDLVALTHTSEATETVVEDVAEATRQPIAVEPEPHPFSDHWPFVRRGVPTVQLHSNSGERGRGWGHTHADTRDKVDDRNVREHGMLTALIVAELASTDRDVSRLDAEGVVKAFRDADFETGMRASGLWPAGWN